MYLLNQAQTQSKYGRGSTTVLLLQRHRQAPRTYQVPPLRTTATAMPGIPQRRLFVVVLLTCGNTVYSTPVAVDQLLASPKPNETFSNEEEIRVLIVLYLFRPHNIPACPNRPCPPFPLGPVTPVQGTPPTNPGAVETSCCCHSPHLLHYLNPYPSYYHPSPP